MLRRVIVSRGRRFLVLVSDEVAEFTGKGFKVKKDGVQGNLSFKMAIDQGYVQDVTPPERYAPVKNNNNSAAA